MKALLILTIAATIAFCEQRLVGGDKTNFKQNNRFFLVSERANWDGGAAICAKYGARMAVVKSEEDNALVVSLLPSGKDHNSYL